MLTIDARKDQPNPQFWERLCVTQYVVSATTREEALRRAEGLVEDERQMKKAGDSEPVNPLLQTRYGLEYEVYSHPGLKWRVEVYRWIPK